MTFLWLDVLWLLLAAPLLVAAYVYVLRRRRKAVVHFPHLATLKKGLRPTSHLRRHVPPALLLVSLCLLVGAAARPAAVVTLASQGGTVIMAMDVSGSMRATDIAPDRITAAQAAAKSFVIHRQREIKVGLVAFSGAAFLVQPPTTDTKALEAAIANLQPQYSTAIGSAVVTSLQTIFPQIKMDTLVQGFGGDQFTSGVTEPPRAGAALGQAGAKPVPPPTPVEPGSYRSAAIVLMTDGRNTTGPDAIETARVAANLGVRIFTIGFGTLNPGSRFYGRASRAMIDEPTLKGMAIMTKGAYFQAKSAEELTKIYQQITTKLQSESQETEISAFFLAGAAFFMLLSALLSILWFHRFS